MGASTLPDPMERYRQARWAAGVGIFTAGIGAVALPVEPLASAVLVVPCAAVLSLAWLKVRRWNAERKALGTWDILPSRPKDETAGQGIYLGYAFAFDQPQAQKLADLASEPWTAILPNEPEGRALPGDPRPWGVGAKGATPYHLQPAALQRMVLALGGTGCGKSTLVCNVAKSGIRDAQRPPVIIIDPKGDANLRNLAAQEAAAAGRPFTWISLYHDLHSATYNPILRFDRSEDLMQRFDAVIPHQGSSSPAFRDNPIAWASTVCNAVYTLSCLLQAMGGKGTAPPPVLAALAWLRTQPKASVDEAIAAGTSTPLPPECAPAGWPLDLFMVPDFALARPHVLMAWMLRLAQPAAFDQIPQDPNLAPPEEKTAPALLAAWATAAPKGTALEVWEYYRRGFAQNHGELIERLCQIMRDLLQIACESSKNRSTVGSALSIVGQTMGRVRRIVSSQAPDLDVRRFCESDGVLYVECSSAAIGPVAKMFGRLLLGDLAAYLGERYAKGTPSKPVWLVVDELAEVVNGPLLQLVAMGRGAGLHALFLTQDRAGLVREIGREGADKLLANMNGGIFQFYTNDEPDAERIVKRAGQVRVEQPTRNVSLSSDDGSGPHDGRITAGTTFGSERQTYMTPDAVMRLPVGCCAFYQGGRLHLLKVALPKAPTEDYLRNRGISGA